MKDSYVDISKICTKRFVMTRRCKLKSLYQIPLQLRNHLLNK